MVVGVIRPTLEEFYLKDSEVVTYWNDKFPNDQITEYCKPLEVQGGYFMQVLPEVDRLFEGEDFVQFVNGMIVDIDETDVSKDSIWTKVLKFFGLK